MHALSGVEMTESVLLLLIWCYAGANCDYTVACLCCLHFYLNGEGLHL